MKTIRINCKTNQEWREERAKSIGASAVSILFGENHWQTPMTLAERMKAELRGEFSYEETIPQQVGHAMESAIAEMWHNLTGKEVIKSSKTEFIVRRDDAPYLHCSPDRTYWIDPEGAKVGKSGEGNKGIIECKTTSMHVNPDDLPMYWQIQLQVQLAICGYPEGYLAWCDFSAKDPKQRFGTKRIEAQPELFAPIAERCKDFWDKCVMGDEIPAPVNAADVIRQHPVPTEGKTVTANGEILRLIEDIKTAKEKVKEIETTIDTLEEAIKLTMADGEESIVDAEGKALVTWKASKPAQKFDSKTFKVEQPDLYKNYLVTGEPVRRLTIK